MESIRDGIETFIERCLEDNRNTKIGAGADHRAEHELDNRIRGG